MDPMTVAATSLEWFERTSLGDGLTLFTEPHVREVLRCNIWHVRGRGSDLLIDTGLGVASLATAATDLFDASILAVATHAHMDHVGGLHEFDSRAIHAGEAEALATAAGNLPLDVSIYDDATLDALTAMGYDIRAGLLTEIPRDGFSPADHRLEATEATMLLADGDVVDLGDRAFEVLHLPGHSPGSIGLYDRANRVLFGGDAIYDGPLLDDLPGSDVAAYLDTMTRLRTLDVEVVHGGHGPSMTPSRFVELIDDYIRARDAA
jgi:glyoxylase-like metal-dependent hydrolase (beta-lactamase superfamily II)